ncbi:N-acetylmannosamine-6-phosphate 2-epimerase, partial [[Clostridium] symbiosum]|nr:N-acetylmannosamine-6-phosphate 2-epimerase [[Clostridium] symbiosum]
IKKTVDLPVIGIIKKVYADYSVYITPTMEEIDALAACGADIIATDGTLRMRPQGESLDDFFSRVRKEYPEQLFMADCSTYEEGMHAEEKGPVAITMAKMAVNVGMDTDINTGLLFERIAQTVA